MVATYEDLAPSLFALLEREGDDLQRYYHACEQLQQLTPKERRAWLSRH